MWLDDDPLIAQDGHSAAQGGTDLMLALERINRIFDLVAAATSVTLLAPIFLITAIAIKLDSNGPIFVREPMFGHGNQRIKLFKFRFVSTRIGQALSETGIHELPQLFNVLRGELSIVGPPPSPCFNPLLNKVKPGVIQWRRLL
jgi:lipopolysaccharide/colanic/teichoic acid biosynthesis glycosyltransferase